MVKFAIKLGIEIELEVDKHFFTETTYFTIKGSPQKIHLFLDTVEESVKEYNN